MRWTMLACGVTLSVIGSAGCDKSQPAPTAPAAVPVTAAPTTPEIVSWSVTGKASLTTIGETTQFTALGTLADGTIVDLTHEVGWASLNRAVVSISSGGLVTVVGFGRGSIGTTYRNKTTARFVTVTPAGTFAIAGRAREPGHSGLPRVRVLATQSGVSGLTDANGEFTLGALVANEDLRADLEGFESSTVAFTKTDPSEDFGGYYDLPMQRIVRIQAGESIKPPPIAPHDVSFKTVDGQCSPCRMIRVIGPAPGVLHVAVYWSAAPAPLFLWVGGIRVGGTSQTNGVSADVPVTAGETIVYVGMTMTTVKSTYDSGPYVTIDLATTFTRSAGTD